MENVIICGRCEDELPKIPDGIVDAIIVDVPYGTTACAWDVVIPLEPMWKELKRIIKPNGAIVMTASQPFTSILVCSNLKMFKYCWVWDKVRSSGFQIAKRRPMMQHEDICVFGNGKTLYNRQMTKRRVPAKGVATSKSDSSPLKYIDGITRIYTHKNPQSILTFSKQSDGKYLHPTQKPVALMEYLILTYTNPGELVLDFTFGSGTTLVAAKNTGRKYIGIEKDPKYVAIAEERLSQSVLEFK